MTDTNATAGAGNSGDRQRLSFGLNGPADNATPTTAPQASVYVASDIKSKRFRRTKSQIITIRDSIRDLLAQDNPQTCRQVLLRADGQGCHRQGRDRVPADGDPPPWRDARGRGDPVRVYRR
jgi:hypothetical protein